MEDSLILALVAGTNGPAWTIALIALKTSRNLCERMAIEETKSAIFHPDGKPVNDKRN